MLVLHSFFSKMLLVNIPIRLITLSSPKLRIPLIKFRYGGSRGQHQKPAPSKGGGASPTSQNHTRPKSSGEAVPDFQLPLRFKRKPLTEEEIEHINRGGRE